MNKDRSLPRGHVPLFSSLMAVGAAALLSGCMGSPTYGTDKTAAAQLFDDVSGIVSTSTLTGGNNREAAIAYKPRPELVRPASMAVLPEPQRELTADANSAWPESPEQRRKRLRDEATENQDNFSYRSPISMQGGIPQGSASLTPEQRAELERRKREGKQGDASSRKYLSEPPVAYRVPNETAAVGDLGEDEWKKEKRGNSAKGKSSLRDLLPW